MLANCGYLDTISNQGTKIRVIYAQKIDLVDSVLWNLTSC